MDNQQPSIFEEKLITLAKNAKFGDGYFWKHPECVNYKVIYDSINPELLEVKRLILPEIFPSGIKLRRKANSTKCFPNSKDLYSLTSIVHPVFTEYAKKAKWILFKDLTLYDLGLWYLDDGCFVKDREYKGTIYYRYIISIGN